MDKYEILSFVGEGSFGRVFKGKNKENNHIVALKVIRKKGRSPKDLKNLRQECDIQQRLKHPNIIKMIESFDTESEMVVVTEFAEKELHSILGKEGCLSEAKTQAITCDLISALYYLHSHRVLHRDLKPQNVLIDSDGKAKLCDFGLARNMTTGTHVLTSIKGTPLYMAPELIDEKPYDHQADLWSLGCIVYELMAGQPPFCTTSIVQLVRLIRHRPVQWPSYITANAVSFLQGLLHKDPSMRMSWQEILVHPFIAGNVLLLPDDTPSDSPFTLPLSVSQMAAKHIQKEMLNKNQKVIMPQAIQVLNKMEQDARKGMVSAAESALMSDDDSIRAVSAISVRDSLRTDDEDQLNVMTKANVELLRHEYQVMNNSNLVVCNLENNMAQLRDIQQETEKTDTNEAALDKKKLSQDLENLSICLTTSENSSKGKNSHEIASKSMSSPSETQSLPAIAIGLSKSVPLSYKQKLLQYSKDKLFGSGNKLTKSLKKSFHIKEKPKIEKVRPLSDTKIDRVGQNNLVPETRMQSSKDDNAEQESKKFTEKSMEENNSLKNNVDEKQSPVEEEEWLAFLNSNIGEVMDGEVESLTQANMVAMVVGALRGSCINEGRGEALCAAVAALLSLPFVSAAIPRQMLLNIQDVYLESKVVPNLVHATKMLTKNLLKDQHKTEPRPIPPPTLLAIDRMLELICQLCLRLPSFTEQFCEAVAMLNAASIFRYLLSLYAIHLRVAVNIVTVLTVVLQDLPENAELAEAVLFGAEPFDVCVFLHHPSDTLKERGCLLLALLGRFCCAALAAAWGGGGARGGPGAARPGGRGAAARWRCCSATPAPRCAAPRAPPSRNWPRCLSTDGAPRTRTSDTSQYGPSHRVPFYKLSSTINNHFLHRFSASSAAYRLGNSRTNA